MLRIIIYNKDKEMMASKRCSLSRTSNINMNQLKKTMQMANNGVESHLLVIQNTTFTLFQITG